MLLTPADRAGTGAPSPWMTKPTVGWVEWVPLGTDCPLVNQLSPAVTVVSPLEVAPIFVFDPEPRSPARVMPTCCGADPVLVTMLSQRTKSELFGTKTLRVTWRLRALKAGLPAVAKMSCRLWPFCMQLPSEAAGWPGLKTRGDGSLTP